MTQEEKELLLKVIGEQFNYNVLADGYPWIHGEYVDGITEYMIKLQGTWINIENVKPYLRPMSSMTEEEKDELKQEHIKDEKLFTECITKAVNGDSSMRDKVAPYFAVDWCNKNHFDYRGLIEKGLALKASEDMYKKD